MNIVVNNSDSISSNSLEDNENKLNKNKLNILDKEINFSEDISAKDYNIDDMIELLSKKINSNEHIGDNLLDMICYKLKNISVKHNEKILEWYDKKYHNDLETLKKSIKIFNQMNDLYTNSSFVIINK
jgi:hypothetical protein